MKRSFANWATRHKANTLTQSQRSTHAYVIGQSGTGKSRAMESWILQDILAGHGVGVIDPHGDLYNNIILRLTDYPEIWERVVLINPFDQQWSISINPLEPIEGLPLERTSAFMTDVMMKIWRLDPTNAPRMLWLVTNTFLALSDLGLTLLELPRFLSDSPYRKSLLPRISFHRVREYFEKEFPKDQESINQWTSPALNKIGALVFDPDIRPMLAGGKTLNLRKVLDDQKILLVNLSKGLLGEAASSLVGAFIIARLQNVALSRVDSQKRLPYYLYLDEFQNYTTDNIKDILTEARKYGLSITFAHQYLKQIPDEILSAVINTAGTLASFRVGFQDALILAREIFPSTNFMEKSSDEIVMNMDGIWPKFGIETKKDQKSWDRQAQLLSSLQDREFWVKRRGVQMPSKHRSWDMPDVQITKPMLRNAARLTEISGRQYGQNKQAVLQRIAWRDGKNGDHYCETDDDDHSDEIPLWQ